jgi:hypothetical protein
MRTSSRAARAIGLVLITSCGLFEPHDCSAAPCLGGLTVVLEGTRPSSYRVEVRVPGRIDPYVVDCPDTGFRCGRGAYFPEVTAGTSANVSIISAGETRTHEVALTYERWSPNGGDCGSCRVATVSLPFVS